MILINKNTSNTIVLTLNEKKTTLSCDVLFKFVNDLTGVTKLFTATDLVNNYRYNEFTIIDDVTEDPYAGQMNFEGEGYWTYTIYQMPLLSPPSLDPDDAVKTLEEGKVFVLGSGDVISQYDGNPFSSTPAYDPS